MNRKFFIFLCVFLSLVAFFVFRNNSRNSSSKQNVIIVTIDTARADRFGCYGYSAAKTPNIDKLAQLGSLFEACQSVSPLTLPAHTSIMTGLEPPSHGLRINSQGSLASNVITLAEVLTDHDYRTGAFVSTIVLDSKYGLDQGFSVYSDNVQVDDPEGANMKSRVSLVPMSRAGNETTDQALKWLGDLGSSNFFCWLHLYDPHFPYLYHDDVFGESFDDPYDAEISFADMQVGRLLEFLNKHKIRDNTCVIIVADHGESLGEHGEKTHGMTLYDATIRVPFIISSPGKVKKGQRISSLVSVTDIFPTLLDLMNIDNPLKNKIAGSSLVGVLNGETLDEKICYAETETPYSRYGWAPMKCIITPGWKYIYSPDDELFERDHDLFELTNLVSDLPNKTYEMKSILSSVLAKMGTSRAVSPVRLSDDEKRGLESLGYVGSSTKVSNLDVSKGDDFQLPDFGNLLDVKLGLEVMASDWELSLKIASGEVDDDVVAACRELVEKSPSTTRFYTLLAAALHHQGEVDDAMKYYKKALELNSTDHFIYFKIAGIFIEKKDYIAANKEIEKALELNPYMSQAYLAQGLIALRTREYETALGKLKKSLEMNPEAPMAHGLMGDLYRVRKDDVKAVKHYLKAINLSDDWVTVRHAHAWIQAASSDDNVRDPKSVLPVAWGLCEKTKHKNLKMLDLLSVAYAANGRFDDAVSTSENLLKLAKEDTNKELILAVKKRLELYKKQTAYIETEMPEYCTFD